MRILSYPEQAKEVLRAFDPPVAKEQELASRVRMIIEAVRQNGDNALVEFAAQFDGANLSAKSLRVPEGELKKAWESLPTPLKDALRFAKSRIEKFHKAQKTKGYVLREKGVRLEHRVLPLQRVGVYVPGGKAAYPSTVLMNVIPAKVAGVKEIAMVTPARGKNGIAASLLGAAWLVGVREVYPVGGAQAVAALAFGTESIPRVDKVVGPGNVYVAMAKRLLFGTIDIDMIAGPSEILIIADDSADPQFVAADLLSQAEHDESAAAILIVIGKNFPVAGMVSEISKQAEKCTRRKIIEESLTNNGLLVRVADRKTAVELANRKAPEHLEVLVRNPRGLARQLKNVGSLFIGPWAPVPLGDYVAGPNHTLPTDGTARFTSPLSVSAFLKESQVIEISKEGLKKLAGPACVLAEAEGLPAHAEAVRIRLREKKRDGA